LPKLKTIYEPVASPWCWLDSFRNNDSNYFGPIGTIARDGLSIDINANICTGTTELLRQTRAVRYQANHLGSNNNGRFIKMIDLMDKSTIG